jgi:hypothetical protein
LEDCAGSVRERRVTVPTDRPPEAVLAAARDALDERLVAA